MSNRIGHYLLLLLPIALCHTQLKALPVPRPPERITLEVGIHNELITAHFREFCKGTFNRHHRSGTFSQFTPLISDKSSGSPFEERCVSSQIENYLNTLQERLLRLEESRVLLSEAAVASPVQPRSSSAEASNRNLRDTLKSIASESGRLRKSLLRVFSELDDRVSEVSLSPNGAGGHRGELEQLGRQIETASQELCGYLNGKAVVHVRDLRSKNIIALLRGLESRANELRKDH